MTLPRFICATERTRNVTGDLSSERRNPHFAKLRQLCGALALAAAGLVQANPVTYYFGGQLSAVDPVLTPSFCDRQSLLRLVHLRIDHSGQHAP